MRIEINELSLYAANIECDMRNLRTGEWMGSANQMGAVADYFFTP